MTNYETLTVGSLFSGIGGLELGLERTEGFRTIWHSEIDPYANAVLRKHWPDVPNLGDIQKIDWTMVTPPDLVCGGFPCQDVSTAGKNAGIKVGTRSGLWFEFAKAIRVLRPRFVLIENVAALLNRGLDIVLANLAEIGYDAEWFTLQAAEVGAPHRRARLFCIAYRHGERGDDGEVNRVGRLVLSDERSDGTESKQGRNRGQRGFDADAALNPANANDTSTQRNLPERETKIQGRLASNDGRARVLRLIEKKIRRFPEFSGFENVRRVEDLKGRPSIPEPLFRGSSDGVPAWMDRIKCLGNAVVPACAQVIGEAILEAEGRN